MAIDGIEKSSLTWRTFMEWNADQIEHARDALEALSNTGDTTLYLRARIDTLREIAALTEEAKPPLPEPVPFDAR